MHGAGSVKGASISLYTDLITFTWNSSKPGLYHFLKT